MSGAAAGVVRAVGVLEEGVGGGGVVVSSAQEEEGKQVSSPLITPSAFDQL
jgi:hypothetical protein